MWVHFANFQQEPEEYILLTFLYLALLVLWVNLWEVGKPASVCLIPKNQQGQLITYLISSYINFEGYSFKNLICRRIKGRLKTLQMS
jgi:hypothetical protein